MLNIELADSLNPFVPCCKDGALPECREMWLVILTRARLCISHAGKVRIERWHTELSCAAAGLQAEADHEILGGALMGDPWKQPTLPVGVRGLYGLEFNQSP